MKNGVECYKDFFPYFKALKTNCAQGIFTRRGIVQKIFPQPFVRYCVDIDFVKWFTTFAIHVVLVWWNSSAWRIVMVGYGSGHFYKKRNCPKIFPSSYIGTYNLLSQWKIRSWRWMSVDFLKQFTSFAIHVVLVWKKSSAWSIVMVGYGSENFDKKRNCPTTEEKSPFSLRTIPCSVDFFLASLFLGRKVLWILNTGLLRTQDRIKTCFVFAGTFF